MNSVLNRLYAVVVGTLLLPSGGFAAEMSAGKETRFTELRVANVRLLDKDGLFPRWSPDGRKLLFQKNGAVWVTNADGKGKARLLPGPVIAYAWSPDGKRVAFARCRGSDCQLLVYDLQKRKEFPVYELGKEPNGLVWSKDGSNILWQFGTITYGLVPSTFRGINIDDLQPFQGTLTEEDKESLPRIAVHAHSAHFGYRGFNGLPFSLEIPGDWMTLGGGPVWAATPAAEYQLLLHGPRCDEAALSPDARTVALSREVSLGDVSGGIYLADLKPGPAWNRRYRLQAGSDHGVAVDASYEVCRKRVNPINNKIVGADTSQCRAVVKVRELERAQSLVEVVRWTGIPLSADDVILPEDPKSLGVVLLGKEVKNPVAAASVGQSEGGRATLDSAVPGISRELPKQEAVAHCDPDKTSPTGMNLKRAAGLIPRDLKLAETLLLDGLKRISDENVVRRECLEDKVEAMKYFAHYYLACVYARGGEKEKAFAALEAAGSTGIMQSNRVRSDENLASLHDDPRFSALLAKYGQ